MAQYIDSEKQRPTAEDRSVDAVSADEQQTGAVIDARTLPKPFAKLQAAESWLDRKLGIERQGIERIPEDEKQPPPLINCFLIWASFNIHAGVVVLGLLGPLYGLSFRLSMASTLTGVVAGAFGSAFNATLGPKTGLRQIASSRFSFGWWGARLCSVLNLVVIGGFLVSAFIVMGQLLDAAANYHLSATVGIVIVAVLSYLISVFGYKVIHVFEKYSWLVSFVLFLVLIGQATPHLNIDAPSYGTSNLAIAGAFLSVLAVNMSNSIGWSTIISDYTVNYPASVPRWKIFALVWSGLVIWISFPIIVGVIIGNAAFSNPKSPLYAAYDTHGVGGLILEIYHPHAFSRFCCVLLSFSALGNGVAVCYSAGLSLQTLGDYFRIVPRLLWSLGFMIVVAVISIAGQAHLAEIVQTFVSIVGYWAVAFVVVLFLEDQLFRRRTGYDLESWNTPSKLPWGLAAVSALIIGYCAGGLPGMAQLWFVGPIARKFGPFGGDVGLWLVGAITTVVYLVARPIEKHFVGR